MMIRTLRPYGAIKQSEVAYLREPYKNRFYAVDNQSNQFEIDEQDYLLLKNNGLTVRR